MASIPKELPDEVLIEILLRLPLLSLWLFKSVCKQWLSLITSEYFTRHLHCGLFIRQYIDPTYYYDFLTMGPKVTSFPLRATIAEAVYNFEILKSCNGLLLCSSSEIDYYVCNPFTTKIKKIPFEIRRSCNGNYVTTAIITNMILAFDPTKSPYYEVLITERRPYDKVVITERLGTSNNVRKCGRNIVKADSCPEQIQIYSSQTGKWRICGPPFHGGTFLDLHDGIYWNNAIHWIHYDDKSHYKLDIVDHNTMVTKIQTPTLDKYVDYRYTKLFESHGSMLLLMQERYRYHVFEMRKESSEWSVKYIVDDLQNIVPVRRIPSRLHYNPFLCIVLGERGDDSFMLIESDNNIVRYNFVSKTVSTLCNSISSNGYRHNIPVPFIASLAGV